MYYQSSRESGTERECELVGFSDISIDICIDKVEDF